MVDSLMARRPPGIRRAALCLAASCGAALLAATALAAGKGPGRRQAELEAKADAILEPAIRSKELVGLALAVVKGGRVVVRKGYGARTIGASEPPDGETVFFVQSLSKGLTAVGALLLADDGKLDLDARISKYLPDVPKAWRKITVRQLLAHQSGIPDLPDRKPSFREMLEDAEGVPMAFDPGTKEVYNNFNFALVGKVMEAASGKPYLELMQERVFGPLGMKSTGSPVESPNHAVGYRGGKGKPVAIDRRPPASAYGIPSGHLQSTVDDLLKLHAAIEGGQLLKPASYRALVTRSQPRFSATAGWFEEPARRQSVVWKNGAGQGFQSMVAFVPGQGHAVVMLWTTSRPDGQNGLFRETDLLLRDLCGVPIEVKGGGGRGAEE